MITRKNKFAQVTLVAETAPKVIDPQTNQPMTPEQFIVYCARVSNPNNQLNTKTSAGLLRYCIKHHHWSIFEQVDLTFEIHTTRDISAQILRHKSFTFQEFSQRYAAVDLSNMPEIELREQGTNKQGSANPIRGEILSGLKGKLAGALKAIQDAYSSALDAGASRETARKILPMNSPTTLYMKGSLRSWLHYLSVRCLSDTQREHRAIAKQIREIIAIQYPVVYAAFEMSLRRTALAELLIEAFERDRQHAGHQEITIGVYNGNPTAFKGSMPYVGDGTGAMSYFDSEEF